MRRRSRRSSLAVPCAVWAALSCARPVPNGASYMRRDTEKPSRDVDSLAPAATRAAPQPERGSPEPVSTTVVNGDLGLSVAAPSSVEAFSEFLDWLPTVYSRSEAHLVVDTLPRLCVRAGFRDFADGKGFVRLATPLGTTSVWYERDGNAFGMYGAPSGIEGTGCRQRSQVKKTPTGWTLDNATVFQSAQECIAHLDSATPLSLLDRDNDLTYFKPGDATLCWRGLFDFAGGPKLVETVDPAPRTTFFEFWQELPNRDLHRAMFVVAELATRRCVELVLERPKRRILRSTLRMRTAEGTSTAAYGLLDTNTIKIVFSIRKPGIGYFRQATVRRVDGGWTFEGAAVFHTADACQDNIETATALPRTVGNARGNNLWEVMLAHANEQRITE